MEIGTIALRHESRDWTSHLAASISLSIAEMAAVHDVGVCDMTWNWLCPDWRRVNRLENMDVCRSLDKEKVKHQPNGTPIWDMSQPFMREPDSYVTFCHYRRRRGSSSLYLTRRALSDTPCDKSHYTTEWWGSEG